MCVSWIGGYDLQRVINNCYMKYVHNQNNLNPLDFIQHI